METNDMTAKEFTLKHIDVISSLMKAFYIKYNRDEEDGSVIGLNIVLDNNSEDNIFDTFMVEQIGGKVVTITVDNNYTDIYVIL
jgi:hypothetical protein